MRWMDHVAIATEDWAPLAQIRVKVVWWSGIRFGGFAFPGRQGDMSQRAETV